MSHLTYPEAGVVGLIQGITELFPISSLGHNVLIPQLVGGRWAQDLNVSLSESPYLAYVVGLHVATALAMIIYFWRDWVRIIGGFFTSIGHLRVRSADERLAWLIVLATIPVGIAGLALEHMFRVVFSKPIPASVFLVINGIILFAGERLQRRRRAANGRRHGAGRQVAAAVAGDAATSPMGAVAAEPPGDYPGGGYPGGAPGYPAGGYPGYERGGYPGGTPGYQGGYPGAQGWAPGGAGGRPPAGSAPAGWDSGHRSARHSSGHRAERQQEIAEAVQADQRLSAMGYVQAVIIGGIQVFALLPGISREGIVMVGGMFRGLTREDAARFSFLLSAPVILAAGLLKIPDLFGPLGKGIHGQVLFGSILSFIGAYLTVRFFMRYVRNTARTLTPFAIYCVAAGVLSAVFLTVVR